MTKTLEQLSDDAIKQHLEFKLLDKYHKELFEKDLTMYYINYSLDYYNNGIRYHNKKESLKSSLINTMELMINDYMIIEDILNY